MKKYKIKIIPMKEQTDAHFKTVRKPSNKTFKNEKNAMVYYLYCKNLSLKNCFDVIIEEELSK